MVKLMKHFIQALLRATTLDYRKRLGGAVDGEMLLDNKCPIEQLQFCNFFCISNVWGKY